MGNSKQSYPGIIIGKHPARDAFLATYGQTFAMLAAEPGSGKGVGAIIPNLLTFPDSVVVSDPKKENWDITAGWRRQMGHQCFCFQPESLTSHRYNPMAYLRRDTLYRMADIRTIASILYSPGDDSKNKGWYKKAGDAFSALVLYLMETPELPFTLPQVYELAAAPAGVALWIEKTVELRRSQGNPLSHECERELLNFAASKANPSGFASTEGILKERLSLFAEKTVAAAVSGNDFDFRQLRKEKMSIYFCVSQTSLPKFGLLMNLFFTQAIQQNTGILPEQGGIAPDGKPVLRWQVLMVMDEFAVMGVIDIMKTAPALTRAFNVRYLIIFQNKNQLRAESMYGREGADAIMKAIQVEIVYAMSDVEASEAYSRQLGTRTERVTTQSRTTTRQGTSNTRNTALHARPLMLPQEIREMPYDKELIFINGTKKSRPLQIKARKIFWYEEAMLAPRGNLPTPPVRETTEEDITSLTMPAELPKDSLRPEFRHTH